MENLQKSKSKTTALKIIVILILVLLGLYIFNYVKEISVHNDKNIAQVKSENILSSSQRFSLGLSAKEKKAYDEKMLELANLPVVLSTASSSVPSSVPSLDGTPSPLKGEGKNVVLWPVKGVYPNQGALLPFNRIVAYYGNLYSKGMGILGEYPENVMLEKLSFEAKKWQEADPNTPVVPALHYIAVVAQAGEGRDGKYRARMPGKEIDKVLEMARKIDPGTFCGNQTNLENLNLSQSQQKNCGSSAIVFLDIQVGLSSVKVEVPLLEKYLKLPNVHLGIDPEFAMRNGTPPGKQIGSLDAEDINFAIAYLSNLVKENNLPPKVLVVHRFTQPMLTNAKKIEPTPEVQVVVQMDGFGSRGSKLNTYKQYVYKEPVQFSGFKLFYKNDTANGQKLLLPQDLLKLSPRPSYIQFQ